MSETTQPAALTTVRQRVRPTGARMLPTGPAFADDPENPEVRALKDYSGKRQMEDPFRDSYTATVGGVQSVIEPPYSFYSLMRMPNENSVLGQCVDAMVTNVVGHGWRLEYVGEDENETSPAAERERSVLEGLLSFPNEDGTLQDVLDKFWRDYENLGFGALEVGRDEKRRITMISHIPAHTVRMTRRDTERVEIEALLPREGKMVKQKVKKRFRRFVQLNGQQRVYFKEFGDPRIISPVNGDTNDQLTLEDSATEIIVLTRYNPSSPYGLPRWFNQLPAIMGTRQSELTNLDYFSENAVPAMVLLVSGGQLTQASLDAMETHFMQVRGRKSVHRVMMLEATGDENLAPADGGVPVPKLEIKPLRSEQQGDALFQNYEANNRDKVRSAFRLPPLFIGLSNDYTYATAKTSQEVAEAQVFAPDRHRLESIVNLKILSTWNPQYWAFRLNPPRLSDPDGVVKALEVFDKMGGLTPNIAIAMANQFFNLDIPAVEDDWGDYPFPIVMELVKTGRMSFDEIENDHLEELAAAAAAGSSKIGDNSKNAAPGEIDDKEGDAASAAKADVPPAVMAARDALLGLRSALLSVTSAASHAMKGDSMPVAVRVRKRAVRARKRAPAPKRKLAV